MGGYSSGSSGGPSSKGTKKQAKVFQKKNEPTPIRDFIAGGGVTGAIVRGFKEGARKSKANVMDYEGQAAGVTPMRAPRDARTGRDNNNNNQVASTKSIEQPKVVSQMDNTEVKSDLIIAKGPTDIEMDDDELALKRKRRGRKTTILTGVTGVEKKPTLSKKVLLG